MSDLEERINKINEQAAQNFKDEQRRIEEERKRLKKEKIRNAIQSMTGGVKRTTKNVVDFVKSTPGAVKDIIETYKKEKIEEQERQRRMEEREASLNAACESRYQKYLEIVNNCDKMQQLTIKDLDQDLNACFVPDPDSTAGIIQTKSYFSPSGWKPNDEGVTYEGFIDFPGKNGPQKKYVCIGGLRESKYNPSPWSTDYDYYHFVDGFIRDTDGTIQRFDEHLSTGLYDEFEKAKKSKEWELFQQISDRYETLFSKQTNMNQDDLSNGR